MAFDKEGFEVYLKQSADKCTIDSYPIMLESLEKKHGLDIDNMSTKELDDFDVRLTTLVENIRRTYTDKKYINTYYETPRSAFRRYRTYKDICNSKEAVDRASK